MASTTDQSITRSEWAELSAYLNRISSQAPVIVGGDFNTPPESPAIAEFAAAVKIQPLYESERFGDLKLLRSWTPDYRSPISDGSFGDDAELLDYLFVTPPGALRFKSGRIVMTTLKPRPSDHLPVMAEVELGSPDKDASPL
jgi:endonuclease/exonuclease/phosphatase family metal-dependent hydrolase